MHNSRVNDQRQSMQKQKTPGAGGCPECAILTRSQEAGRIAVRGQNRDKSANAPPNDDLGINLWCGITGA